MKNSISSAALRLLLFTSAIVAITPAVPLFAQPNIRRRPAWTTSRITGAPEPPKPCVSERVFPSLEFNQPVELVALPGTNRLLVLEVGGKIFSFENRVADESLKADEFGDIKARDADFGRLYGIAFHPRFEENRLCYISYVSKGRVPEGSRVSRFKVSDTEEPRLIPESEEIVLRWYAGGHNGANLRFGPDGYLYISTGDSGDAFPPDGRHTGQSLDDLEAAILRIDVNHRDAPLAYRIPPDNPFVGRPGARGEIWAFGLRNPWKMAFDPADGSLWAGDVGWEKWEMVYQIERGANYGWSIVEGPQPVLTEHPPPPTPISPPAVAHSHTEARSITGGFVSQTPRLPELKGTYVYGDYVTGKVWGLKHQGSEITWREELVDTPLQIVSFGQDQSGDVLLVDYPTGTLHRLATNPRRGANDQFPRKLSETGLFADTARHIPAAGVMPYQVNAEPWADGTLAERLIALPGDTALGVYTKSDGMVGYFAGDWRFPTDGVLAKTVSIELEPGNAASRRRIETQILHFDFDTWKAYNYLWNDEQTDALLADDVPTERTFRGAGVSPARESADESGQARRLPHELTWQHASRTQCLLCHTSRVGTVLGFKPPQLERDVNLSNLVADAGNPPRQEGLADTNPTRQRGSADTSPQRKQGHSVNQLNTFASMGLFAQPLPPKRAAWPDPHDVSAPLEERARVYLHVNCGHCHTRGGGGSSFFDVQYRFPLEKTSLIGTRPTQGTFGMAHAEIVAPGDPYRSVLYYRMSKLGHGRMPQIGSQVVDLRGTRLMREWIGSMKPAAADSLLKQLAALDRERQINVERFCAEPGDYDGALSKLLTSPGGALLIIGAIEKMPSGMEPRQQAITRGYAHPDPAIRDLFERFIPADQRIKRLGTTIQPAAILSLKGDAERGRTLFWQAAGVQCKNCHKVGDEGQPLGPDLTQIGKKLDKPKLLESILEPSKTIDPQFVPYLVETTGGEVTCGLLVRQTDAEVVLRKADGKEARFATSEIDRLAPQQKSLMPELLLRDMTAEQVADLLEYLAGRK